MTSAPARDEPFRWALVGLGRHARRYLGPAIAASRLGVLAAVCSRDPEQAARTARAWGEPAVYRRLDDLLEDGAVAGVILVSPNHLHKEQVLRAAAAGKHVLCEKPLATSAADCREMIAACRRAGVRLGTGFHLRHNIVHEKAREAVADGQLGEITYASARYGHATAGSPGPAPAWRLDPGQIGGGAFMGTGVHAVDLLRFVTGGEIAQVTAVRDGPGEGPGEQNMLVAARLGNGAVASIHGGNLPYPANELVVCGTAGTLRCTGSIGNAGGGLLEIVTVAGAQPHRVAGHDVYARQCDDFVTRVRAGTDPDASGTDGLRCAEVTDAAYASAQTGMLTSVAQAPEQRRRG
jgi:1,5-anhydro-D-fructose reductase (1,5-anhydro-D-mannitol-forming)